MKLNNCFLLFLMLVTMAISQSQKLKKDEGSKLRVMTWNVWRSGTRVENGMQKIAKHISLVNPDVVAFQEMFPEGVEKVKKLLGPKWNVVNMALGPAIFTKHEIISNSAFNTSAGIGCKIKLDNGKVVNHWSAYLHWDHFGPEFAHNNSVKDIKVIMDAEGEARLPSMNETIRSPGFQQWLSESKEVPIIFCGDFNTPSHLDWIEENKHLHNNWVIEWPTTKLLESYGFIDSYRHVHPNVSLYPALSWSPINKKKEDNSIEPQERIDFIFYKGPLVPVQSTMYTGNETVRIMPDHFHNDFPSDHSAFITDFSFI